MSSNLIPFPLDQKVDEVTLVYRPWGTRTLKLKVTTTKDKENLPPLRLRPKRMADVDTTGITCGYADTDESFLLSWGGGHEPGPCIKASDEASGTEEACISLKADAPSFIFLNVTHMGPVAPATAVTTLEAYDPETNTVRASLAVTLQKPESVPDDLMRLEVQEKIWKMNDGRSLPVYDPRWWPHADVTYKKTDPIPLCIRQEKTRLSAHWADLTDPIITIEDNTSPSMLTSDKVSFAPGGLELELFDFDEHHFVLRVWFFWLNRDVGFKFTKMLRHEVPDAERFDFLIRKQSGKVVLACTDLHWQEIWGQVTEPPLKATVGLTLGTMIKVVREKAGKIIAGESAHKLPYDPGRYVKKLADRLVEEDKAGKLELLAKGWEAHVPSIENVEHDPLLASSDVRLG